VGTTELATGNIISGGNGQGAITNIASGGMALASSGTAIGTVSSNFFNSVSGSVSGAGSGAGATDSVPSGVLTGVYMNGGSVTGGVVTANGGIASAIFSSPPVNTGSNGDLYWGRWTNTTLNLYSGLGTFFAKGSLTIPATASIHYLLGTSTPTVFPSSATFNFIGGTPSTDTAGGVGSGITTGQLQANFGSNLVTGSFVVNHNGTYNVNSLYLPIGSNRAAFGTDHGIGGYAYTSTSIPVQVNGFFVGSPSPTGAGLSYTIQTANPIVGVGAFR
jgi:hypothetical protein